VIGWIVVREPVVAVVCVVVADLTACLMMTPEVMRDPESETLSTSALASVGGALAAGAVGEVDLSLLLYPVYFCVANAAMAIFIHRRRTVISCPSRGRAKGRPCPTPRAALGWPGPSRDGSRV
jgi:hypothetical protein